MTTNSKKEKGAYTLFFCLLLLASCSTPCRQWQSETSINRCSYYNSGKIFLPSSPPQDTLELELTIDNTGLKFYVNIFQYEIEENPLNSNKSLVTINCDFKQFSFLADRFEGGQRLLLPEEALTFIIDLLTNNHTFEISVDRYKATIVTDHFLKAYTTLMNLPVYTQVDSKIGFGQSESSRD